MNSVLLVFLSLAVSGSILALTLLTLNPLIKNKLSQTWQYYIWLIVILRFLLPFTPQISIVGEMSRYVQNIGNPSSVTEINPGIEVDEKYTLPQTTDTPQTLQAPASQNAETEAPTRPAYWHDVLSNIWLLWIGVALVLFVHKVASYRSFVRFVNAGTAKITNERILDIYRVELAAARVKRQLPLYENNQVVSPMLVGILRPSLVVPALGASDDELRNILRHELTHYKRLDFLYKWLVQITLCLHWFNPLVYLINKRINKICELSCDESVISHLETDERIIYGDALIASLKAQGNYSDFVVSMTMSEDGNIVKERLDMIMSYRKKSRFILFMTALLTVLFLCGATVTGAYAATANVPAVSSTTINSGPSHEKEVFNLTDRFGFAGGYHTNTTFTLERDATIQISTNITATVGQLNFAIQPIHDGDYYRNNALIDKGGNVVKKLYEASGSNVQETQTISLEAGTYWASLTGAGNIQNADWKITGTIITDKRSNPLPSGRTDSLSKNFEKYKPFGVVYNAEQDAVYYNGKRVKLFVDFKPYKEEGMTYAFDLCYHDDNTDSTLYLEAVKNSSGNITGIRLLNDEIVSDLLESMSKAYPEDKSDKVDNNSIHVTMDATQIIDSHEIVVKDLTKDKAAENIKTWMEQCDKKQGAYILKTQSANEYLTYIYYNGGGRHPWHLSVENGGINANLYSNSGLSTTDGYCLIYFTAPKDYAKINLYLDNTELIYNAAPLTNNQPIAAENSLAFNQTTVARNWNSKEMKSGNWFGWERVDVVDESGLVCQAVVFSLKGSDSYKQKFNTELEQLRGAYPDKNTISGYLDLVRDNRTRNFRDADFFAIEKVIMTDKNGAQADAYIIAACGSDNFMKPYDAFSDTVVDEYFKAENLNH